MTTDVLLVFLDANILAKPVTRTLLLVGGVPSRFRAVWSATAEHEASRHMRSRATPLSQIRRRFGIELSITGREAARFTQTRESDRQILADAAEAGAQFLITGDVDDFGSRDLASVKVSATHPDLFLAEKMTRAAYTAVIDLFVERQVNPPTSSAQFHAALARKHPRLFEVHADLYDIAPVVSDEAEPAVIFRGTRCLRCEHLSSESASPLDGLCTGCR